MNNEKGFTLIEVLIALVLLGISFTILVDGYRTIIDSSERNSNYHFAANWSEKKMMEIVNNLDYGYHGDFEENGIHYRWVIEEEPLGNNLSKLNLIMNWQGFRGEMTYSSSRYILRSR
ncbi:type II secretion system protein [Natronospora cellulosivora (SeqCode)]